MLLLNELFHSDSYHTFLSIRTVVSHDNQFIAALPYLIFKDHQVFVPSRNNREHPVSCSLQCLYDRQHRSCSDTSTGTEYSTVVLYMGRATQWSYDICHIVTFVELTQLSR